MKFTRSFPANANARERVPASTVSFRMLIRNRYWISPIRTVHPAKQYIIRREVWSFIHVISSCGMMAVSFRPLKIAKYEMAVSAMPHHSGPMYRNARW